MAKRKQEIKVRLHIMADDDMVRTENSEEFWISKIKEKMQLNIGIDDDKKTFMQNLIDMIEPL